MESSDVVLSNVSVIQIEVVQWQSVFYCTFCNRFYMYTTYILIICERYYLS